MITKLVTVEEYKSIFSEMLINKTRKITKISPASSMNGIAYGAGKLATRINKDIAVLESQLFYDVATGDRLDSIARQNGVGSRFGARQSSAYVRISAAPGTTYQAGIHTFYSTTGVVFDLESDFVMSAFGFGYAKVRSRTTGEAANVPFLSINKVLPQPTGHLYVVNDYNALYGADRQSDDFFRKRAKAGPDALSRSTIGQIEQVFMKSNENVMKVYYGGVDTLGRIILMVLTENGIDLSSSEINDVLLRSEKFFSLLEFRPANFNGYGVVIRNVDWQPIDVSMRVDIDKSYDPDAVRKDIQVRISKYLDYRYWKPGSQIEWDNLLEIVKTTDGIRYVNDAYFYPSNDLQTDIFRLPRIRGFQLLDLNGNMIKDFNGVLNPIHYPADKDFSFQATVLQQI